MSLNALKKRLEGDDTVQITIHRSGAWVEYMLYGSDVIAQGAGRSIDEAAAKCLKDLDR